MTRAALYIRNYAYLNALAYVDEHGFDEDEDEDGGGE